MQRIDINKKIIDAENNLYNQVKINQQIEHKLQLANDKNKLSSEVIVDRDRKISELSRKVDELSENINYSNQAKQQIEQELKNITEKYKQSTEGTNGWGKLFVPQRI